VEVMPDEKTELAIRELCQQIAAEENPGKLENLVKSLQHSVEIEHDETRLRLRLIAQQYRDRIRSAPLRHRMLDVIRFLGLTPHRGKISPEDKLLENELKEKEGQDKHGQSRTDSV
jgi:hypothetical protein